MLFYLLLGILFFYLQHLTVKPKIKEKIIKLSLSNYIPEVIPPPAPKSEPIVVEEEVAPVEPEPIVDPIVKKVLPKPKKIVKIKKKKIKKKKRIVKKRKIIKKTKRKRTKKIKKVKTTKYKSKKSKKRIQKQKNRKNKRIKKIRKKSKFNAADKKVFLGKIHNIIDRHKSYPRIAERRGIRGTIKASFMLFKNGHIGRITLSGPKIFYSSARKAIKSAFPIDVRNVPLSLPTTINSTLRYR